MVLCVDFSPKLHICQQMKKNCAFIDKFHPPALYLEILSAAEQRSLKPSSSHARVSGFCSHPWAKSTIPLCSHTSDDRTVAFQSHQVRLLARGGSYRPWCTAHHLPDFCPSSQSISLGNYFLQLGDGLNSILFLCLCRKSVAIAFSCLYRLAYIDLTW